jgi:hypothetical protein
MCNPQNGRQCLKFFHVIQTIETEKILENFEGEYQQFQNFML